MASSGKPHPDPISSHVLDTSSGRPAESIPITMFKYNEDTKDWDLAGKRFEFIFLKIKYLFSNQQLHFATLFFDIVRRII